MSKFPKLIAGTALATLIAAPTLAEPFGLGREALPEEIAAWNLDIAPDGSNLPVGSGSVEDGEMIFSDNCAACHGEFAEGSGNWPKLAGGDDTLANEDPLKTVGSYWPYLSTVYDYVRRSMPFGAAQTISDDDVYAMVAYILYSNYLVEDDFVLSNENFMDVEMPNADGFIVDDRAETEYPHWTEANACYEDCKDDVQITMRATVLDVTPEETEEASVEEAADDGTTEMVAAETTEEAAPEMAAPDPELVAAGENVFKKCKACHKVGEGAKNGTGPMLNGVMGHPAGQVDGFRYSSALEDAAAGGLVWDEESLAAFLAKPRDFIKGTKMSFVGLRKDEDIAAVSAYLSTFK
ncbi:c-type cytochrome [Maritimibacter sp. UBA3975]|uniref:c-type cytochrome n=1 Tax=Maritimibacter sp. UBA3975 TaxID=1946833 RepID=UPI000C0ADA4B|nr:c-type cytochrome [Maritimibacter sp. UBA3975]MAM60310.1 MFS transporter [Maritimibacter sp.]|tara:strand:- start:32407 stop:33459 length:1053 start_codon:yes stop_codon:yes gene_type:complete